MWQTSLIDTCGEANAQRFLTRTCGEAFTELIDVADISHEYMR